MKIYIYDWLVTMSDGTLKIVSADRRRRALIYANVTFMEKHGRVKSLRRM
jgi:hypothetical protein